MCHCFARRSVAGKALVLLALKLAGVHSHQHTSPAVFRGPRPLQGTGFPPSAGCYIMGGVAVGLTARRRVFTMRQICVAPTRKAG
jgi:hypothetical protein